jgi:hypothetical protein
LENISPFLSNLQSPVRGLEEVTDNTVLTVQFRNPKFADDFIFPARKLPKAKEALRVLNANEGPVIGKIRRFLNCLEAFLNICCDRFPRTKQSAEGLP